MWIPLSWQEVRGITHYVGVLIVGLAILLLVPFFTAVLWREWNPALDYLMAVAIAAWLGTLLMRADTTRPAITPRQAFLIAPSVWLTASFIGAIPLAFSGHYGSFLDALFETVSGFTTSGLTLTQDVDHLAYSHNMWRHMTHLIGGQGIIVAALSFALGLKGGAFSLYLAEGRDERILPNVIHTARFIWIVTGIWVAVGTVALAAVNLRLGMAPDRSLLHGFWITAAAYDTGGFAPQSQNAMYYHSALFEFITLFLMLAGMLNFNLHADLWRGDKKEIFQNLEARTVFGNLVILAVLTGAGLGATSLYSTNTELLRKGIYHIVSAHSGTGHQAIYASQWKDMSPVFFFAILLAMAFGGMVSSTAGGIKALRIGVILKGAKLEVHRLLSPPSAVVRGTFHHIVERAVTPQLVSTALMVFALYLVTYLSGGVIGTLYGYGVSDSLFESISAAANVGLSTGITSPTMPTGLKITYMIEMWAGRFEFFTLAALFFAIAISLDPRKRAR